MNAFEALCDELLIDSYKKSIELDLETDFVELLKEEIKYRGLTVKINE
ncbi:sporulation histidine kinase inhibitor Sda [Aquibacillus albus]|uniref:Sporulation histidine kinase inhibitor Sda n=1 Tax=Aquibacillus albus TaxID=1168171 RepID=A0ABS2N5T9_9BACI|nr:sporulation histidine kinase inhibitor Sda [Aquibacillus albus]MBM7573517.1 hypothetical protein [Aquibacillus albus]